MSLFVSVLYCLPSKEGKVMVLLKDMELSRIDDPCAEGLGRQI